MIKHLYSSIRFLVSCILVLSICQQAYSQPNSSATINSGGGTSVFLSDFTLDWNIGESTITDSYASVNNFSNPLFTNYLYVTCGILQPFDYSRLFYFGTNPNTTNWSAGEVGLFPVPTKDKIIIDFKSYATGKISVFLYDNRGLVLNRKTVTNWNAAFKQDWDLAKYQSGIYFFHILLQRMDDNTIIKSGAFQIVKL